MRCKQQVTSILNRPNTFQKEIELLTSNWSKVIAKANSFVENHQNNSTMKNIKSLVKLNLLLLLTIGGHAFSTAQSSSTKMNLATEHLVREDGTHWTIEEAMSTYGLKGLSVAVFENYEIAWTKTWGVKDVVSNDKIDENTAFCTASISKPVTATLFAILEEKGLIDLKAPVSTYLKRWTLPESELTIGITITLEHLLSHTAGTSQHGHKDLYEGDHIPSLMQSLNGEIPGGNSKLEFLTTPGTEWRYSGGGYVIAQLAVEDHLGKSLVDLAEEHLFSPLKLKNTTFKQPNEAGFLSNIAKSHNRNGQIIRTGIQISPQLAPSGLWSTPTDLAMFMIEIQKALNEDNTKVISTQVAKRLTDIVTLKIMGGWSLGWERRFNFGNYDWFSHGGSNGGMGGHIYATMTGGNGIAFFGNSGNTIRIPILNSFRNSIIKAHAWNIPLDRTRYKTIPQNIAKEVKGNYSSVLFGEIVPIEYVDGRLFAKDFDGGRRLELFYLGNKTFKVDQSNRIIRFNAINPADNLKYMTILMQNGVETNVEYALKKIGDKLPFEYLQENNYEKAVEAYKKEKSINSNSQFLSESVLNRTGYQELAKKNYDLAFSIFKINTILYPESANVYDSLGELYLLTGNRQQALINYKKSLELDPNNEQAKEIVIKLLK